MRIRILGWVLNKWADWAGLALDDPRLPAKPTPLRHPIWFLRLLAYPIADCRSVPADQRSVRIAEWTRFFDAHKVHKVQPVVPVSLNPDGSVPPPTDFDD